MPLGAARLFRPGERRPDAADDAVAWIPAEANANTRTRFARVAAGLSSGGAVARSATG